MSSPPNKARDARLREMMASHFDFIWRTLRRFGLPEADADDASQQVFLVASNRLDAIAQEAERPFLFRTATNEAMHYRRGLARRPEISETEDVATERRDSAPGPDQISEQRSAREMLDRILEAMPMDLKTVFVLTELEEMTLPQIAELLSIPLGTATSRLRRAREDFGERVARITARESRTTALEGAS